MVVVGAGATVVGGAGGTVVVVVGAGRRPLNGGATGPEPDAVTASAVGLTGFWAADFGRTTTTARATSSTASTT